MRVGDDFHIKLSHCRPTNSLVGFTTYIFTISFMISSSSSLVDRVLDLFTAKGCGELGLVLGVNTTCPESPPGLSLVPSPFVGA